MRHSGIRSAKVRSSLDGSSTEYGRPANARRKLDAKSLDLVVLNDATEPGAGFGVDTNRVTLVARDGEERLELMPKAAVADALLDRVERLLARRAAGA